MGQGDNSEEWDKKKYIPRFWECSGSQPPKWSVCRRHLSPGWQNVILYSFFFLQKRHGKEMSCYHAPLLPYIGGSLFLKHVNRIRERDLELKQLRLKFFEIKLISAINGTSLLTFR